MDAKRFSAHQQAKIRRLSTPQAPSSDDEAGEINIVPFLDMVVNIMMFVLATVSVTFTATIASSPPSSGNGGVRPPEVPTLNLTLVITNDGVSLKAAGGNIAPGCETLGPGITFPYVKGSDGEPTDEYYASITACAKKLKDRSPDFKSETQIRVMASNNIMYRRVISCIDAVRNSKDGEELFPDVLFAVAR
jgi:biopolymer transport protein TolR